MLVLLLMTAWGRHRDFKNDFGKKRKLYGWTHADRLPNYPPDVCLFCSCQPGACANTMCMGVVMGVLAGVLVGVSLGTVEGVFLGGGCGVIIIGVGSAMVATAEDKPVRVHEHARPGLGRSGLSRSQTSRLAASNERGTRYLYDWGVGGLSARKPGRNRNARQGGRRCSC
eukprot:5969580-Prymnesium_polylepis.1